MIMTTQVNLKIDPQLKKEAEKLAKKLGLNLSTVLRMLLMNFVHTKKIDISLGEHNSEIDTDPQLTGALLQSILLKEGKSKTYAEAVGQSYDVMMQAEKDAQLIHWKNV